jgi:hypothetical protein
MSKAKKWIDPQDVEITDPMHKAFITDAVAGETEAGQGKAFQALVDQLWLREQNLTNAPSAQKQRALNELHKKQRQFDPDDLNLAGARKAINKLGAGDNAGAVLAAQASIEHREAIRQDTKTKLGAAGRNTRSKNAEATKRAIIQEFLKSRIPKKQAYHHYAKLYGIGWTTVRDYLIGV